MATVVQLNGPMWAVDGHVLEVPAGVAAGQFLSEYLATQAPAEAEEPVVVTVQGVGREMFGLIVNPDGSVTTDTLSDPEALGWLRPAREVRASKLDEDAEPAEVLADVPAGEWNVYGVHPGAGATTWAGLLDAVELSDPEQYPGRLLVVARTTLRGVQEAKTLTHRAGVVLMVADAPGKFPADVRRGIKVLSGAAPIVTVPWLPPLRGALRVPESPALAKATAKIAAAIRDNWKDTP
jgi:hypothetical protein